MADQKLTALTAQTTPADEDLLYTVDDPAGTPVSKKITWTVVKAFLLTWISGLFVKLSTPSALTDGSSVAIDCESTDNKLFTLASSNTTCTLALANLADGHTVQIVITPQSVADYTYTFTHTGLTCLVAGEAGADLVLSTSDIYRVFATRVGSNVLISYDSRAY